jgi:3-oxoacyl-[acyl-carrier protein] reductase
MTDRYQQLIDSPVGGVIARRLGLPQPVVLERYRAGDPVISGPVLLGGTGGRLAPAVTEVLAAIGATAVTGMHGDQRFKALILDATGIGSSGELVKLWELLHPTIRRLTSCGRVIVLGTPQQDCAHPPAAIAQRALEGLVRALGKELRHGATAQLVYVSPEGDGQLESTLRFLLSPRSAYVSGQVIRVGAGVAAAGEIDWDAPLAGRVALVTGAARGIGAAIAQVLARDGAHVVGLDIPAMAGELAAATEAIGDAPLIADITDESAPATIAGYLAEHHGGVDVVVHNAGVTRDRTLGRMDRELWESVIAINLTAPQRIDQALFERDLVRRNGRIVAVSSISGIAGNAGQTNYSTSKAGVIGFVQAWAPAVAKRGVTLNAVAPGFIETRMTAAMPLTIREAGRRMNSLSQGGLPVDVAETIAWLASPASTGVNGNIVRVCGQSLLGA